MVRVLFSTSFRQAPLCLTVPVNLYSLSCPPLSFLLLLHLRYSAIAAKWRLFSNWPTNAGHSEHHRYDASLSLWQDLKPVDVTNKRSLWENKGASPTKVAIIHLKLFPSIMMRNLYVIRVSKWASRWSFNYAKIGLWWKDFPWFSIVFQMSIKRTL